jgi:hypothetical protein
MLCGLTSLEAIPAELKTFSLDNGKANALTLVFDVLVKLMQWTFFLSQACAVKTCSLDNRYTNAPTILV